MPVFGSKFIFLDSVDSTNNYAATLIEQGKVENGTVVMADYQEQGRGQRNNYWQANKGENLTFSLIWLPDNLSVHELVYVNWWVSLTLVRLLASFGIESQVKWPNDILVENKKIAGILMENKLQGDKVKCVIIGVGLNVNQVFLPEEKAVSMSMITGEHSKIHKVLMELCVGLNETEGELKNPKQLKSSYEEKLFLNQETICFTVDGIEEKGRILGINDHGQLLILHKDLVRTYNSGEITQLY